MRGKAKNVQALAFDVNIFVRRIRIFFTALQSFLVLFYVGTFESGAYGRLPPGKFRR